MPDYRLLDSWWKKRTKLEKSLVVGFFLLAIVFIISLFFHTTIGAPGPGPLNKTIDSDDTCLTEQCVQTAGEVFNSLDETVDPCQNFYNFACGNYLKSSFVLPESGSFSHFYSAQDTVLNQLHVLLEEKNADNEPKPLTLLKEFYRGCKNNTLIERHGLDIAKKLLNDLGGWPILDASWNETEFDWIDTIAKFRARGVLAHSLINIDVTKDFKNTSKRVIGIGKPIFGLNKEYLINGFKSTIVNAYYDYMVDIAEIFGANTFRTRAELLDVIKLEILLAKYATICGINPVFLTVEELETRYKKINWLKLINNKMPLQIQVNRNEPILVQSPKFLRALELLISSISKRTQANYIMWRALNFITPYLNQKVNDRRLIFNSAIHGEQIVSPRWKECASYSTLWLSVATGASYVRRYFHEETKKNALEMVTYIQHQVKDMLGSTDWLDNETKHNALDKVNNMAFHIGHPDELLDDKKIEEFYNKLDIDETQLLYSVLNITKFLQDFRVKRLREPVNKTDWRDHDSSTIVNAFYQPNENSIILPAAILQGAFFHKDRPNYMNFGAIGSIIGHEITHAFDNKGSQYDKNGNMFNWWNNETQNTFLNKTKCMIQQYDNFSVPEINMNINGEKTLGENIADNGGVKQTYLAYKNWQKSNPPEKKLPGLKYTQNQLFWLSAAQIWCSKLNRESITRKIIVDVHSPPKTRVLAFLKNSEYFAKDYNCPLGSEMNPKHKCSVW